MSWLEVFVVALTAQLAVLPGEKVQFIIAGLSTRYNPWIVVAAAGTAFAGWTAIEIVVGNAPGREDLSGITVFDSTGLAIQDIAAARIAYESLGDDSGHRLEMV